ncbi:MAG: response regulator [Herpetosiphonaceae bacterium]|nr:response regulator [Herpetosiphonaceae bacterium]
MKTILVVEDEPAIAEVLLGILEDAGYHVELAINGQACLACLEAVQPDLILSDLAMPLLDGRGLYRALRAQATYATIPFVIMTAALVQPEVSADMYDGVVSKPFMLQDLLNTIARCVVQNNT